MNILKRIVLIMAVSGLLVLNFSYRDNPETTDGTITIEQNAGETDEWTAPVF